MRRRKGLVKIEGRGCANGRLGRCDGQAVDGEAGGDGQLCALAGGRLSEGPFTVFGQRVRGTGRTGGERISVDDVLVVLLGWEEIYRTLLHLHVVFINV